MFSCSESNCDEKFNDRNEFVVHRSYHEYHQKLKNLGREELDALEARLHMAIRCPLEDRLEGCYYFPQLPTKLICCWFECKQEFLSVQQYYDHVANHAHRHLDRCYWDNCTQSFKRVTLTLLREHLRVHTLQKLYACPHCGNFFSNKVKFDDHFLRHLTVKDLTQNESLLQTVAHNQDGHQFDIDCYSIEGNVVKVYRCTYDNCDKTFLTSSLLREHLNIHSSKNKCDQCSFVAISAAKLKSHKLYRHQNDRNYECTICLKTFKQRGDLRAHVRRHQIVEPYKCDKCDFETLNEEGLNKHSKLHLKDNGYLCHICKRVFSRGSNLSRHFKDQHELEPANGMSRFRYRQTAYSFYVLDSIPDPDPNEPIQDHS